MKTNWFRYLWIRLRWTLRSLRKRETTDRTAPKERFPKLLLRLAELWHLIRLLISLIHGSRNGSGKN